MAVMETNKGQEPGGAPKKLPGKKIGPEAIIKAKATLLEYQAGKKNLDARIRECEEWWKQRNWEVSEQKGDPVGNPSDMRPKSSWLFHTIVGKHADMMAAFPEPNILPREESDKYEAETLTAIVPVILQHNHFEDVYDANDWAKNISGGAMYGVFWDKSKLNGMGDIAVTKVSILNLFWQPGLTDIQKSPHLFHAEKVDIEALEAQYPYLKGKLKGSDAITMTEYQKDDHAQDDKKVVVVDWYYKKYQEGRTVLHYVKFTGNEVLYATEDDPMLADRGLYDDGDYPYVPDPLFHVEGSPIGFGYVDVCKSPQMSIDLLNQQLLKSAISSATPRWFVSDGATINMEEYLDLSKPLVKVIGAIDDNTLRQIEVAPPSPAAIEMRNQMIEEMKYTSGNLDVVNGGTTGGVTAYRAINALIDTASRSSKSSIQGTFRAYSKIVNLIIERIRQFYNLPRQFRITGKQGEIKFMTYTAKNLQPQSLGSAFGKDLGMRKPVFDVEVRPQKQTEYNKLAQNEWAIQLYQMGAFNPQMADQAVLMLQMMEFKGKEDVLAKVQQNSILFQMIQMMQQQQAAAQQQQAESQKKAAGNGSAGAMQASQAAAPTMQNPEGIAQQAILPS